MAVRSVYLQDLMAIRALERADNALLVAPSPLDPPTTAVAMALGSSWRGLRRRAYTFILYGPDGPMGFIQGVMRPHGEAWEIVRLACLGDPDSALNGACASLIEQFCQASGNRGSLRTFARVPTGGEALRVLSRAGFRQYTKEYTLVRPPLDEQEPQPAAPDAAATPLPPGVRLRHAEDNAWSIFVHLYCAITPQSVRHAEGRSSKDWRWSYRLLRRWLGKWMVTDELVLEHEGHLAGWLQLRPAQGRGYQQLDVLALPNSDGKIVELIRAGLALAGPGAAIQPLACRVREYDVDVIHALEACGFHLVGEEALLVKHSTVRVTERQLLIAALRAQGLARIDLSHYQGKKGEVASPAVSVSAPPPRASLTGAPVWGDARQG